MKPYLPYRPYQPYLAGASIAVWTPATLFANSEVGVWYDPSALSTLFQDAAGTTPVTADGQPVGKILDKSGNGYHATQSTAASRPLYKTDGTYHWLQFDGVDDSLATANIDFTATNEISVYAGVRKASDVATGTIVELSAAASASYPGSFRLYAPSSAGANTYGFRSGGTISVGVNSATTFVAPITNVIRLRAGISADRCIGYINTAQTAYTGGDQGTGNFGTYPLYIGRRASITEPFVGNVYSMIVRGALSSTEEITVTEAWVNSKTGAY